MSLMLMANAKSFPKYCHNFEYAAANLAVEIDKKYVSIIFSMHKTTINKTAYFVGYICCTNMQHANIGCKTI